MSEDAAVAAVEAPTAVPAAEPAVEAPTTPEPAAPEAPRETGSLKSQARRAARQRAKQVAAQVAEGARERALQPREPAGIPEGGQFAAQPGEEEQATSEPEVVAEAPTEPETVAAQAPTVDATDDATSAAEVPDANVVKIPLPENHPFRARGITEWDAPAARESEVRGMLNAVAERAQLREQTRQLEEQVAALQARTQVYADGLPAARTPELEFLLNEVGEKYSPETKALLEQSLDALNQQAVSKSVAEATEARYWDNVGRTFVQQVESVVDQHLPVWAQSGELAGQLRPMLDRYGASIEQENAHRRSRGQPPKLPNVQEFMRTVVAPVYANDPKVRQAQAAQQQSKIEAAAAQARADARKEFEAKEREKLTAAAQRHASLPPGTGTHSSTGNVMPDAAQEARETALRSHGNRKTMLKRAIRDRFGGR